MRRFFVKCVMFSFVQMVLMAVVLTRYDMSAEANYLAATLDKHNLLKKRQSPRIVLAGGSNVAFGFDTEQIERSTGRAAINMGLAAGLGIEFMLSEIQPELRQGDTVLLSFEYDHFARGPNVSRHSRLGFDAELLRQVLVFRPEGIASLRAAHFRKMVLDRGLDTLGEIARRGVLTSVRAKPFENAEVQSTRRAFNDWGDLVAHRREPPRAVPETINSLPLVADVRGFPSAAALRCIREFVEWSTRNGIEVAFTFPPKPAGAMFRGVELAQQLARELSNIPGLIVLDTPQDHSYPPEQFFDTANHLTAEGAAIRTARVITSLKNSKQWK